MHALESENRQLEHLLFS